MSMYAGDPSTVRHNLLMQILSYKYGPMPSFVRFVVNRLIVVDTGRGFGVVGDVLKRRQSK